MLSKHRPAVKLLSYVANEFAAFKETGIVQRYAGKDHPARSIRKRCFSNGSSSGDAGGKAVVLESDYGPVTSPNMNLPQYLWKDVTKWGDKPMVVRCLPF